jgi:predicted Ser/Thr protein kinase
MAGTGPSGHEDLTTEVAVEDLDPLLGTVIEGRFRIVSAVGKGAMGRVYRAVQEPLNRAVALKVLDSNYGPGRDEGFRRRFLVEAALTAKLTHPNTVRVVDYGCSKEGLFFLAMEYLDGETLDKLLEKGALPWRRVLGIAQQIARALREAHQLGVVHRDLKPANVMLLNADDDHDFVKVLDFGLVKSFVEGAELEGRDVTRNGMLMGSPPYMAPEQGERNVADPRSDIYSLGVVMFEALTGRQPYVGNTPLDVVLKHVNEPVPPVLAPAHLEPLPETLARIVTRCLAKSPMDRFESMEDLLTAMQELAVPQPTSETPIVEVPTVVAGPRELPARRSPVPVLALVGAAVAGMALTAVVLKREVLFGPKTPPPVLFHVDTEPPGATVRVAGEIRGVTPTDISVPVDQEGRASLEAALEKPGYLPASLKAKGSGARVEVTQALQEVPPPPPPQKVEEKVADAATAEKKVEPAPEDKSKVRPVPKKTKKVHKRP